MLVHFLINSSTGVHAKATIRMRGERSAFLFSNRDWCVDLCDGKSGRCRIVTVLTGFIALTSVALAGVPREEAAKPIRSSTASKRTYNGFRRYNAVCNHCHGPDGVGGSFGPSLIEAPPDRLLVYDR